MDHDPQLEKMAWTWATAMRRKTEDLGVPKMLSSLWVDDGAVFEMGNPGGRAGFSLWKKRKTRFLSLNLLF